MASSELHTLTIGELAPLLRAKRLSPVELTEHYLARIDALDEALNAYITVTAEQALAQARAREAELVAGDYRGPLHGIPIALKDLYDTAGVRTTAGAKTFAERVPSQDAHSVNLLREAGAVILGKTNMHEWAFGVTGEISYFGPTHNPWHLDRMAGGSSSGSGAAVAAGLCVAATGSDTGGSIRIPAALCGIVGLKPSYGLISTRGLVPLSWTLDHAGPMARSVYDVAVMLGAMSGWDPADPASVKVPALDYTAALEQSARGLRIGVDPADAFSQVDPEVAAAVRAALDTFTAVGMEVVEVSLGLWDEVRPAALTMLMSDAAAYHEPFLEAHSGDYLPGGARTRLEQALAVRGADYARARRVGEEFRRALDLLLEKVDLLAMPMCAIPAPRLGQSEVTINGERVSVVAALARYTRMFNLAGVPAITVPCGFSEVGLPVGLQLVGARFSDSTVLRAAHAFEQATDRRRLPLVAGS